MESEKLTRLTLRGVDVGERVEGRHTGRRTGGAVDRRRKGGRETVGCEVGRCEGCSRGRGGFLGEVSLDRRSLSE